LIPQAILANQLSISERKRRAFFFLYSRKRRLSEFTENHLVLIFQANRFVRLQELAQFSTIKWNPLPRRQRACPSVSLDKKVMCCY